MSTISSDDLRAILAGCEGVTTGPWANGLHYRQKTGDRDFAPIFANSAAPIAMVPLSVGGYNDPDGPRNAAHIARLDPNTVRSIITELLARRSPPAQEGMVLDAPAREAGGETKLIDDIINGTAPMSKWMGSVDYSTYDGFEEYLKTQLREKLDLKVRLDKKRHESAEDESLATFVDGGSGALEAALATYRTVRERVAAASPAEPAAHSLQTDRIEAAVSTICELFGARPYGVREQVLRDFVGAMLAASPSPPSVSEPVPYAWEFGRSNGDDTYSVVIERGRERPKDAHPDWPPKPLYTVQPMIVARAEAAEQERDELREAIKPFAELADEFHPATRGDQPGVMTDLFHQGDLEHFTINDFRRARAALSKPKPHDETRGRE